MKKRNTLAKSIVSISLALLLVGAIAPLSAFAAEDDLTAGGVSESGAEVVVLQDESGEDITVDVADSSETQSTVYTVSFINEDGSLFEQAQVTAGAEVAAPATEPSRDGCVFLGWYAGNAADAYVFAGSAANSDITLYARFEAVPAAQSTPAPQAKVVATAAPAVQAVKSANSTDAEHLVTFQVNGENYYAENVLHETLVTLPQSPTQAGTHFVGWFTQGGVPFNAYQVITENVTLTAKFDNNTVLVTYLDTNGMVLEVTEGTIGEAAPAPSAQLTLNMGEELRCWALNGSTEAFTAPLSKDVTLVPVLANISMAVFVTGGSEVSPQAGQEGFTAKRPGTDPTRDGYIFNGWSANEDGTGDFDFAGTPINGTVFVYARWTATSANYTVNIWVETAAATTLGDPMLGDRTGYEVKYTTVKSGETGAQVTYTDSEARADAAANTDLKNLLTYSTFAASETRALSGNGDTTVNIYYTRTRFTYNFDVKAAGGEIFLQDGTSKGSNYTLTVKLEQDVSAVWPSRVALPNNLYFLNWSGYYSNNSARIAYSHISVAFAAPTAMQTNFYYDITTPRRHEVTLTPKTAATCYTETRVYYLELTDAEKATYLETGSLPGETVREWTTNHATYGGTRYYKKAFTAGTNNQSSDPKKNSTGWPGRDFEGFEVVGSTSGVVRTDKFQETVLNSGKDYTINYFMPRKSNTLTLVTGKGTIVNPNSQLTAGTGVYTATVKYDEPVATLLPADVSLTNYVFEGWYLDDKYENAYTGATMSGGNLTLYAKYRGVEVTVQYTDGQEIVTRSYARGEKLLAHNLSGTVYAGAKIGDVIPGKGTFMGWYYEVGDTQKATVEFPLGLALTRDSYVVKAQLLPASYTVTFRGNEDGSQITYTTQTVHSGTNNTLARSGHTRYAPVAREGYIFKGWSTTADATVANFTTATPVLANTTVYAVWELQNVTLNYDANGGELVADNAQQTVAYGQSLQDAALRLPGAVYTDNSFDGWYTQPVGGTEFTVEKKLTDDTTVYAHWTQDAAETPVVSNPADPEDTMDPAAPVTPDDVVTPDPATPVANAQIIGTIATAENLATPAGEQPPAYAVINDTAGDVAASLNDNLTPQAGLQSQIGTWSLLSLMLGLVGLATALILMVSRMGSMVAGKGESHKYTGILRAAALLMGPLAGIVFLAMNNLAMKMTLVNASTPWVALALAATLVLDAVYVIVRRKEIGRQKAAVEEGMEE